MTTAADLLDTTRRHLGAPETLNQIAAVNSSDTTVTLQRDLRNIGAGTLLSVGLETLYVWAVTNQAGRVVEVRRGHQGSVPASHADGDLVRVAPTHTDFAILGALNDELRALTGAGLFQMKTLTLTASDTARSYDLATDVQDVYAVLLDTDTDANTWPEVRSWVWRPSMPTAEFPSGNALRIDSGLSSGRPVRVLYKAALGTLTTLADNVLTTTGLPVSAHDIPPLGAAWRLVAPTEVERNQTNRQGDSRRADEVPAGARLRSPLGLQQVRQTRIREELNNLARTWPPRGH